MKRKIYCNKRSQSFKPVSTARLCSRPNPYRRLLSKWVVVTLLI